MSSGTQADMDWAGTELADGAASSAAPRANVAGAGGARELTAGGTGAAYLTDEEILGIAPPSPKDGYDGLTRSRDTARDRESGSATANSMNGETESLGQKGAQTEAYATDAGGQGVEMPAWMAAAAADPKIAAEAQTLWAEHQEFCAAFGTATEARTFVQEARAVAEEARAIKELLPGGVRDIVSLREATQSVERIDAALFSGDARAQADVVAEMARVNPAAFRSMFAEAARVMAGLDGRGSRQEAGGRDARNFNGASEMADSTGPTLRQDREGWGTQTENQNFKSQISNLKFQDQNQSQNLNQSQNQNQSRRQDAGATNAGLNAGQAIQPSQELRASQSPFAGAQGKPNFDPAAYAAFERSTNDTVARDVRGSISDTLARVMPEGVAEGAARRIGEDIFNEVHRALAADRALSEQVASC